MDVRRLLAALMLLALLVSCSDDEPDSGPKEPTSTATVSPSPTGTETQSGPTAPVLPPVATRNTLQGAKAFVRHYLSAVSYAMQTGESEPMHALSSSSCRACETTRKRVDHVYGEGGRVATTGWHDESVLEDPSQPLPARRFFVRIRQSRQTLFDASGVVIDRDPAKTMAMRISLTRTPSGWLVAEMELVQ